MSQSASVEKLSHPSPQIATPAFSGNALCRVFKYRWSTQKKWVQKNRFQLNIQSPHSQDHINSSRVIAKDRISTYLERDNALWSGTRDTDVLEILMNMEILPLQEFAAGNLNLRFIIDDSYKFQPSQSLKGSVAELYTTLI